MKNPVELAKADAIWKEWRPGNTRTALGSSVGAASAAKPGYRMRTGALAHGRGVVGAGAGGGAGAALGAGAAMLTKRPGLMRPAAIGGGLAGASAGGFKGAQTSINNSRRKGYLKPGM